MHADLLLTPVSRAGIWPLCFIRTDRPGSSGAGRRANLPPVVRVCGDSPVARRRARRRGPNGRQGFAPSSVRPCSLPLYIISREAAKPRRFVRAPATPLRELLREARSPPCAENSREAAKHAKLGHGWRQFPSRLRALRVRLDHPPVLKTHAKPRSTRSLVMGGGSSLRVFALFA